MAEKITSNFNYKPPTDNKLNSISCPRSALASLHTKQPRSKLDTKIDLQYNN